MRFGFDLTPLFERLHELAVLAAEVMSEREQIAYLRTKIRSAANDILAGSPDSAIALSLLRALRRKLTLNNCEQLLSQLPATKIKAEDEEDHADTKPQFMSGNDGQIVRHHQNSNTEHLDKEETQVELETAVCDDDNPIKLAELLSACPEAAEFAHNDIRNMQDVVAHGRTLAPMIGINSQTYEAAHEKLGPLRAALTVWAIMQFHGKIRAVGAYYRSITTGSKSAQFSPEKLIRRLAKS